MRFESVARGKGISQVHNVVHAIRECCGVGSLIADAADRGSGHPKDVSFFVQSMIVRTAKLQGHGDEEGILGDALNVHFGAEGPESWHVRVAKRSEQKSATGDGGAAHKASCAQATNPGTGSPAMGSINVVGRRKIAATEVLQNFTNAEQVHVVGLWRRWKVGHWQQSA